jgi:hypothetical protein
MTEQNIESIITHAGRIISLRTKMDNIISIIWGEINRSKDVQESVNQYNLVRGKLKEAGVSEEDISFSYDSRFKDLPWEECGYQAPQIT